MSACFTHTSTQNRDTGLIIWSNLLTRYAHNPTSIIAPAPVEWALTGVFTIELLLRYYVAEDKCVVR